MKIRLGFLLILPLVGCQPVDPQGNPNQPQGKAIRTNVPGQLNPNVAVTNTVWDHKGPPPQQSQLPPDTKPGPLAEFEKHYGWEVVREQDTSDFKAGEIVQYMNPEKGPRLTDPKVKILDPMDGRYAKILDHEKNGDEIETYIRSELLYRPITVRTRYWNKDTNEELTREAYEKARRESYKAEILPTSEKALAELEAANAARRAAKLGEQNGR